MTPTPKHCNLCGPRSPRAKIRDGLCGRCYHATTRRQTEAYRSEARVLMAKRRARLGGKATLWVAFGRNGDVLGVYSSEAKALPVSAVTRAFQVNRLPRSMR